MGPSHRQAQGCARCVLTLGKGYRFESRCVELYDKVQVFSMSVELPSRADRSRWAKERPRILKRSTLGRFHLPLSRSHWNLLHKILDVAA